MTGGWFLIALTTLLNKGFRFWVFNFKGTVSMSWVWNSLWKTPEWFIYTNKGAPVSDPSYTQWFDVWGRVKTYEIVIFGWNNHPLSSIFRVDPAYAKVLPFWAVRWITSCPMAVLAPPEDFSLNCPRDRERWSARWTYLGKPSVFSARRLMGYRFDPFLPV